MVRAPGCIIACRENTVKPSGSCPNSLASLSTCLQCADFDIDSGTIAQAFEARNLKRGMSNYGIPRLEHERSPMGQSFGPEFPTNQNAKSEKSPNIPAAQTHTPPEEALGAALPQVVDDEVDQSDTKRPKKHQGWPKGKPRGPRASNMEPKSESLPQSRKVRQQSLLEFPTSFIHHKAFRQSSSMMHKLTMYTMQR